MKRIFLFAFALCACSEPSGPDTSSFEASVARVASTFCTCYYVVPEDVEACKATGVPDLGTCETHWLSQASDAQDYLQCITESNARFDGCISSCPGQSGYASCEASLDRDRAACVAAHPELAAQLAECK